MQIAIGRFQALVGKAQSKAPWVPIQAKHFRLSSTLATPSEREAEFQMCIDEDLTRVIKALSPERPPIMLAQMLDADVNLQGVHEGIVHAADLVRVRDHIKYLTEPAAVFYQALLDIGLQVTIERTLEEHRSVKKPSDGYHVHLYVSLPPLSARPLPAKDRGSKKQR